MKTIKVIDLLNKIASGEELPKKIYQHCEMFGNATFELDRGVYWYKKIGGNIDFIEYQTTDTLNDEVEIIEDTPKEDKKIEKLSDELTYIKLVDNTTFRKNVVKKLNEIIDYLNNKEGE